MKMLNTVITYLIRFIVWALTLEYMNLQTVCLSSYCMAIKIYFEVSGHLRQKKKYAQPEPWLAVRIDKELTKVKALARHGANYIGK